jgi:hypothetical protein
MDIPNIIPEMDIPSGRMGRLNSLPAPARAGFAGLARLPHDYAKPVGKRCLIKVELIE